MFYMKHKGTKLEIREDNVYTKCPVCGKEKKVDLVELIRDGGDLFGTMIVCGGTCIEKQRAHMEV